MVLKGYKLSEEHRRKLRENHKGTLGLHFSTMTRKRMSIANTGHRASEETLKKMSIIHTGHVVDKETRKKISIKLKNHITSSETRKKISIANTGKKHPHSEETKRKMSITRTGKKRLPFSSEWRKNIGITVKNYWRDPTFAQMMFKAQNRKPTQPELYLDAILQLHFPHEYKYTGDGAFSINGRYPDFTDCNGQKKCISFNGFRYTKTDGEVRGHTVDLDKKYDEDLLEFGYTNLNLDYPDLIDENRLIKKVKEFNNS